MAKTTSKPETANVVYRGKREELQGRKFQIPAGLANPARFIEEEYDKQQAEAAAKAEQERQAEAQRQAAAQAAAEAKAEARANVPEEVEVSVSGISDTEISDPTNNAATHVLLIELRREREEFRREREEYFADKAQRQAENEENKRLHAEMVQIRDQNLATMKANLEITNEAFGSYAERLQAYRGELNEQAYDLEAYRTAMQEGANDAAEVKKIRSGIFDYINSKFSEYVEAFVAPMVYSFMNVALRVIGIDRNQALMALNDMKVSSKPVLTKGEFNMLMATYQRVNDVVEDAEQRTNENSRTAADLFGASGENGGGVVKDQTQRSN